MEEAPNVLEPIVLDALERFKEQQQYYFQLITLQLLLEIYTQTNDDDAYTYTLSQVKKIIGSHPNELSNDVSSEIITSIVLSLFHHKAYPEAYAYFKWVYTYHQLPLTVLYLNFIEYHLRYPITKVSLTQRVPLPPLYHHLLFYYQMGMPHEYLRVKRAFLIHQVFPYLKIHQELFHLVLQEWKKTKNKQPNKSSQDEYLYYLNILSTYA